MTDKERITEHNNQLKECIALAGEGGSGSGGSAPTILDASSTVEDFVNALETFATKGTECAFYDDGEVCRLLSMDTNGGVVYFFKASRKQLIIATLGDNISISKIDLGGSGSGSSNIIIWNVPFDLFGNSTQTGTATLVSGDITNATELDMLNSVVLLAGTIPIPCVGGYPGANGIMTYRGAFTMHGSIWLDVNVYAENNSFTLNVDLVASKQQPVVRFVEIHKWTRWATRTLDTGEIKVSSEGTTTKTSRFKNTHAVVGSYLMAVSKESQPFYDYSTIRFDDHDPDDSFYITLNATTEQQILDYLNSGRVAFGYFEA